MKPKPKPKPKKKVDVIRTVNRQLDKAINSYGKAIAPRPQRKASSFFDIFWGEVTGAPKRRR